MACDNLCLGFVTLTKYTAPMTDTNRHFDCETPVGTEFVGLAYWSNNLYSVGGSDNTGHPMRVGYACYEDNVANDSVCSNFVDYSYSVRPFFKFSASSTFSLLFHDSNGNNVYVRGNTLPPYYAYGNIINMPVNGNSPQEMVVSLPDRVADVYTHFLNSAIAAHSDLTFVALSYPGDSSSVNYSVVSGAVLTSNNNSSDSSCVDLRSSGSTESLDLGLSGQLFGDSYNLDFDLLFQPDSEHTHGELHDLGSMSLQTLQNGYCRFDNAVSPVRGVGTICLWAHLKGTYVEYLLDKVPVLMSYDGPSKVLFCWSFDDPCCPYPTGISNNVESFNDEYVSENLKGNCEIVIDKVVWDGFDRLFDYCCDESSCAERSPDNIGFDGFRPDEGSGEGGEGGEGGSVDITCVCDELINLNERLGVLNERLLGIKTSIDNKDLTVTVNPSSPTIENTIQVEPTPITVNPSVVNPTIQVNPTPITVNPSTINPTIQVEPTPITVNPSAVNPTIQVEPTPITINPSSLNPTIQVNPTPITVEPSTATVQVTNNNNIDGLMCDDESLACILKNALNHDDESISKIIKDKDTSSFVDVTVEPNELVNIRKVHYTGYEDE